MIRMTKHAGLLFFIASVLLRAQGSSTCSCTAGIPSYAVGSEPACDSSRRGSVIVSLGDDGQSDFLKACIRDAIGRYSWSIAGQQNTNTFRKSRTVGGCPIFPDNNVWNSTVDSLAVDVGSAAIIGTYASARLGTVPAFTLNLANSSVPTFPVNFSSPEVDPGPYPISGDMIVEGYAYGVSYPGSGGPYDSDAHLQVLQTDQCKLYEIFALVTAGAPFSAGSGAVYDLTANNLRPDGWTSADAAGLPIWPGVLTYQELYGDGEIRHMVRFTVDKTRNTYIWPARHYASHNGDPAVPPMGSRWRLKASVDETTCHENEHSGESYPPEMRRLIRGLKHYGMILADNGSAIRISTDADSRWGDPNSETSANWSINGWAHCLTGRDFEVVNTAPLMVDPNSAAIVQ